MAEFLGDLAFMFEVLVLGLGLTVLHFNKKESSAYLKWSGRLMTTFGILGMICTGFFYMKYLLAGEFNHAYHMNAKHSHKMRYCLGEVSELTMDESNTDRVIACMENKVKINK